MLTPDDQARVEEIRQREQKATAGPWYSGMVAPASNGLNDMHFVQHAREDVPFLLDLVTRQAQEQAKLADAIHPKRDAAWTVEQLAALASAHRDDTDTMDSLDNGQTIREALTTLRQQLVTAQEALKRAEQFIVNGTELGYIRMPDPETPDSAHETLPAIRAALVSAPPVKET
jgi:acyl-CoA reductase-like NAD-dependent aldehyde dehydrogenase